MNMFTHAQPVYIRGLSREMNAQAGFTCVIDAEPGKSYTLVAAGSTYYRIRLDGELLHFGPARGPHGYLRCDRLPLPLKPGRHVLAIDVAGYNCVSFYTMNIPSFLQAEVRCGDEVLAYTGRDFKGVRLTGVREQKVIRYSFQRAFTEVWRLNGSLADWTNGDYEGEELEIVEHGKEYLERGFELPLISPAPDASMLERGIYRLKKSVVREGNRFLDPKPDDIGFAAHEFADDVVGDTDADFIPEASVADVLSEGQYARFALDRIRAGFLHTKLRVLSPAVVYVTFSEYLKNDRIDWFNDSTTNIIKYELPAGTHTLASFEPYSFKFIGIMVKSGAVEVESAGILEFSYPVTKPAIVTDDPMLQAAYDAAFDAFRYNTIDCFTDCPGRERAGWLCDSFFSAKASYRFTGSLAAEQAFLDNFRLPSAFPKLPEGLLPMCYPAENRTGNTIPQWTMWYVLEVADFKNRGGDASPYRELLTKILRFFESYENADGLLEKLPYWNFVEWSRANKWVQDVCYPTNMLYHRVLLVMADILERPELLEKAAHVKSEIIRQSYDGRYFQDHALRGEDGTLTLCGDFSAICQHEAVFFGVVDENAPEWADFMDRIIRQEYPEDTEPLDLFPGLLVRTELLHRMGLYERNLREIAVMFGERMAAITGTLWEHRDGSGSRNHGIASSIACIIADSLEKLAR